MCLTLIINMNTAAFKFREHYFFKLHRNNCLKAQVSVSNAVDLEASGSSWRGFVSVWVEAGGGWGSYLFI